MATARAKGVVILLEHLTELQGAIKACLDKRSNISAEFTEVNQKDVAKITHYDELITNLNKINSTYVTENIKTKATKGDYIKDATFTEVATVTSYFSGLTGQNGNPSGCSGSCTGLCEGCSGNCYGTCLDSCSGCSGSCEGGCDGCTGSCTSCSGTCSQGCTDDCHDGCGYVCAHSCEDTCWKTECMWASTGAPAIEFGPEIFD